MEKEIPDDAKATALLSNERTFLAWVRTAIAIISLGFVVAKFGLWLRELSANVSPHAAEQGAGVSRFSGAAMVGLGGVLVTLAALRYHVVNRQIAAGLVRVDHALIVAITAVIATAAGLLALYLALAG